MFKTKVFQQRRKSDNTLIQTDAEAAEELPEFFKSDFVNHNLYPNLNQPPTSMWF